MRVEPRARARSCAHVVFGSSRGVEERRTWPSRDRRIHQARDGPCGVPVHLRDRYGTASHATCHPAAWINALQRLESTRSLGSCARTCGSDRPATSQQQALVSSGQRWAPTTAAETWSGRMHRASPLVPKLMMQSLTPSADDDPRLHGGRKDACGVAPRWRKRHPCPHRSDEQRGQDEGDRGKCGSERETAQPRDRCGTASSDAIRVPAVRPGDGQIRARLSGSCARTSTRCPPSPGGAPVRARPCTGAACHAGWGPPSVPDDDPAGVENLPAQAGRGRGRAGARTGSRAGSTAHSDAVPCRPAGLRRSWPSHSQSAARSTSC
jgi:hypothetical protein